MRSKIGIFRALDVRVQQVEFAAAFKQFEGVFVANLSRDITDFIQKQHITHYNVPLKPKYLGDPIYPFFKKKDFTPWLHFDRYSLEKVVSDLKVYEIYEPYFFYSGQIASLAHKRGVPLVTEIWTSFPYHPARFIPPYSQIIKNVLQQTDLFILRSNKAKSYLEPFAIAEKKQVVIYQGVNLKRFIPRKKNHEKLRILFVGALAAHKGLDDLLTVFEELTKRHPNKLELVVCGEGPLAQYVTKMAKFLPISFLGYIPNTDLSELYKTVDIYCQPSKDYYFLGIKGGEEFAGYTFMEAMASGIPIVSTYCGGIPEVVGEDNLLVSQGNKEALHQSLHRLITDVPLRLEIGTKNRERAEIYFDLDKQTHRLESIINSELM